MPDLDGALNDAADGENYENTEMYPEFAKVAREEGFDKIAELFERVGAIEKLVDEVFAANPQAIADWKKGKTNVAGWLMGQVMKKSQGKANPNRTTELVRKKLSVL